MSGSRIIQSHPGAGCLKLLYHAVRHFNVFKGTSLGDFEEKVTGFDPAFVEIAPHLIDNFVAAKMFRDKIDGHIKIGHLLDEISQFPFHTLH